MSVYTQVDAQQLEQFLSQYALGNLVHFVGIADGITNTNYFVTTSEGDYVLTLFEHTPAEEIGFYLHLMNHLAEAGIPTPPPIANKQGAFLMTLSGKPAALVAKFNGRTLQHANLEQCKVMGAVLAKTHLAAQSYQGKRHNDRDLDWMHKTLQQVYSQLSTEDQWLLTQALAEQSTMNFDHLPGGVIHADLFCDNTLFDGDQITGIIDWYYAINGSWLYDLAVTINDWAREENGDYNLDKFHCFLEEYQKVRPLTAAEKSAWPLALKRAALRFWLSRLQDKIFPKAGHLTLIKDPEVFKNIFLHHQAQPLDLDD